MFLFSGSSFERDPSPSRSSNNVQHKPFRIYRIPFSSVMGIRCERRCPSPSTHLHSNFSPGDDNTNANLQSDKDSILNSRQKGEEVKGMKGSKTGMHLQVDQAYSSRSCTASPTRHLSTHFPSPPSRSNAPLSPLKSQSSSPSRGINRQRNRTNSLTVEMGSFPFRPIGQKHPFSQNKSK